MRDNPYFDPIASALAIKEHKKRQKSVKWSRVSKFSNTEQTECARGRVTQTCSTSGSATRWRAEWPGGQLNSLTTKAIAKRVVEQHINPWYRLPSQGGIAKQSRKKRAADRVLAKNKAEAIRRACGWCCIRISSLCQHDAVDVHHRLAKSQGGTDDVANLTPCCRYCHDWVHENPATAAKLGYIRRRSLGAAVVADGEQNGL